MPELSQKHAIVIRERIRAAVAARDERDRNNGADSSHFPKESERNLALVSGNYWEKVSAPHVRWINHIAPAMQAQQDVLTAGDTQFYCDPTKPVFDRSSDVAKGLLNYAWKTLGFEAEFEAARWDVPIHGYGVVEIGWVYESEQEILYGQRPEEIGPTDYEPSDMSPEELELRMGLMAASGMFDMSTDVMGMMESPEDAAASMAEDPIRDDPWIERFDPRMLLVDPQCTRCDLSDARYVFRQKREYLSRIQANPQYSNTENLITKELAYCNSDTDTDMPAEARDDAELVTLYDGYVFIDIDDDGREELLHVVFADQGDRHNASPYDKPLLVEEAPYDFARCVNPFPFVILPNWKPDQDTFQPARDVSQVRNLQISHDESSHQFDSKRKSSTDLLLAPEEVLTSEKFVEALESNQQNRVLPVNPAFLGHIKWLDRPMVNTDVYKSLSETPEEIKRQLGVSDFQIGGSPTKAMTATEAQHIADQGGTRQRGDAEVCDAFRAEIGHKVIILFQTFMDRAREYAFQTDDGRDDWGTATMELLRSTREDGSMYPPGMQVIVHVTAASEGARTKWVRRQEASELSNAMSPFLSLPDPQRPGLPLVNARELARHTLREYEVENIDMIVMPEPDEQDQIAMLTQQLAQASQVIDQLAAQLQAVAGNVGAVPQQPPPM